MKRVTRREAMQLGVGALVAARSKTGWAAESKELTAGAFRPLTLGEVKPTGWLRRQLRLQADGLGGHLDEFWPDVGPKSGWLGGTGESWERGPYFLDGLIPLAMLLDDNRLKAKAHRFVDWTLTHQQANGMIGPPTNDDWWPRMVMVKALAQWQEATGDARVIPVLTRYFHHQLAEMPGRPLKDWGRHRWQDEVLVVEWVYDRTHDPELLRLCVLLRQQGFDWQASFHDFKYTGATKKADAGMDQHGVNNGQALKVAAVEYRLSGDLAQRQQFFGHLGKLDEFHGVPSGMFTCDEHLAGRDPSHGTELCTVVETMYSLEVALAAFGDVAIADRLEKIAFNALPGTFTDDMWAHQYNQQPNQVQVGLNSKPWTTDGPESNLYGLEPNFGCCTANFHQGWPKLATSLWMRTSEDGLAAVVYSPCEVRTRVRGVGVQIAVETDYPFRESVKVTITPEKAVRFPVSLRIPAWASGASTQVNGAPFTGEMTPGEYAKIDRLWTAGDVVELRLPMQPRVTRWFNNSIAVERGPLVFSHDLKGNWVKLRERGMTADWQVYPTRAWNYGLVSAQKIEVVEAPVGQRPFAAEAAPVVLRVRGRQVPGWVSEDGVAKPLPISPIESAEAEELLELVPYGVAKLRITAFPELKS